MMKLLKDRGFPADDTFMFALKPKAGLVYYEFHDHKTGEVVVQWEDDS
jgi:aspartate-semialdehyde dehydrogenase